MKNTFRKYPNYTVNGDPFHYYNGEARVSRATFLDLIHSMPHGDEHVYIDREAGMAVFYEDTTPVREVLEYSRKDFNREAKRQQRAHQCVLKGTNKCDGWKPDENGIIRCEYCTRSHVTRTISMDAPTSYDENDDPVIMDFPAEDDALEILFEAADRDVLRKAINALSEDEREYLLARYQPGMTARSLAERYHISDYRYANRKAQRIVERVRKYIADHDK